MGKKLNQSDTDALDIALDKIFQLTGVPVKNLIRNGEQKNVGVVSTGLPELDNKMIIGGYPKGRIVEIFGTTDIGKTSLALQCVAEAQRNGLHCLWGNADHTLSEKLIIQCGAKPEELSIIDRFDTAEQVFDMICELIKTDYYSVIVLDPICALISDLDLRASFSKDENQYATSETINRGVRKIANNLLGKDTVVIFINEMRNAVSYWDKINTPGGRVVHFCSSTRIMIEPRESENTESWYRNHKNDKTGFWSVVTIIKNKLGIPHQSFERLIKYDSFPQELIKQVRELNLIGKDPQTKDLWFKFTDRTGDKHKLPYLADASLAKEILDMNLLVEFYWYIYTIQKERGILPKVL